MAAELGLPLITVNTNIHKMFPQNHYLTHTYTDMFAVYSLQKLWKTYYYSSTYDYGGFELDGNLNIDPAHFEILLLNCFSTSQLRLYSDGASKIRDDKVAFIADFEPARKYLHVCTAKEVNCGHCEKCMRTLLEMDATGTLEKFSESFDIEGYKKNRSMYYRNLCKQKILGNAYLQRTFDVLYKTNREEFDKYLSEFTTENLIRRLDDQGRLTDRWRKYTAIFEKALDRAKLKENIQQRFAEKNVKTVAFYGDGELRRFLYGIIKEIDGVEVKYIVEDGKLDWLPFPSYARTSSELPDINLMIITDVLAFPAIQRMMKRDHSFDVVSGEELITGE